MSRYIDAEWLTNTLQSRGNVLIDSLDSAPSIDIVRCGECKYSGVRNDADVECKRHKLIMRLNGFCSYGQRNSSEKPNNLSENPTGSERAEKYPYNSNWDE